MRRNEKTGLWHFESHEEIRNYLAQGIDGKNFGHHVYLTTHQNAKVSLTGGVIADGNEEGEPYVLTKEDTEPVHRSPDYTYNRDYSIRTCIGQVEDFPAEDYAVKKIWRVVELTAKTVVEGFYKAGEHLAEHIHTVGEKRTKFTTKELTAVKNSVQTENDDEGVEYLYRIKTETGFYQCHQDSLWWMTLQMEQAEGVGPAKRKAFAIKSDEGEQEAALRLSFTIDKEVQRMKQCLATEGTRPFLMHPVVDTASGVMVASDGHIITVHKLKDYEQDQQGGLPAWAKGMLSVPKEVCQMKGCVTVTMVEGKWEEQVEKEDHTTELQELDGVIVTATDENGRQAVVKMSSQNQYPLWRKVIPTKIGPAISIDMKELTDGVKRIGPQLNSASQLVMMSANAGDKSIQLSGEDYDFSKSGSVNVELLEKMPCRMLVRLKAPTVITAAGFQVKTMHYRSAGMAVLFVGDNTLTLQMPMVLDGNELKKGPATTDKQLKAFDINKWCDAKVQTKTQTKTKTTKPKQAAKASGTNNSQVVTSQSASCYQTTAEPTLAERLREALLRQMQKAA